MENFSQLLNDHIRRAGVSDTELARTIGVSRQTIFRWREGLTGRPRQREDVLVIARKLRLTPEERDKLLLAAGFRPEETTKTRGGEDAKKESRENVETQRDEASETKFIALHRTHVLSPLTSPPLVSSRRLQWLILAMASLLLLVIAAWWINQGQNDPQATALLLASSPPPPRASLIPAKPGETVVLITHFANYASSQVGYNIAGRLAQALQREIDQAHQENIRIIIWPQSVGQRNEALQAGQEVSATLVIYGEYDVGRIVVEFAQPANQNTFADPALQRQVADVPDLSATINIDLPQQVRSLALIALGQIYLNHGEMDQARPLLAQARDNLQDDPQVDKQTWALVNFYLGIAYQHNKPPQLDEAIAAYSQAVAAWPQMISSRLNRSVAYTVRQKVGDLELALVDADQVITIRPDWAVAYNNRGSIRLNMGGTQNLALALTDLKKALTLDATLPEAYLNQAYIHFQQDLPMKRVAPDLTKALALRPDYAHAFNLLCWGYALEQQPELALPYCQQAVAIDPQPVFFDSRGLTYALLGNYSAAIADFKIYRAWLEQQPGKSWQVPLASRQVWIKTLETGQNPFTRQLLAELRHEFGK